MPRVPLGNAAVGPSATASPQTRAQPRTDAPRSGFGATGASASVFRSTPRDRPGMLVIPPTGTDRSRASGVPPTRQAASGGNGSSPAKAAPLVERPSLGEIQRRIPARSVAQPGPAGQRVGSDAGRSSGISGSAATKRGPDSPTFSELRRRIPDANASKPGSALAGEGARGIGERGKWPDVRKRIPNVPDGKLKAAESKGRPGGEVSGLPGKGKFDPARVPDLGRKIGGAKTPEALRGTPEALRGTKGMKVVTPGGVAAGAGKVGNQQRVKPAQFSDRVRKGDFNALERGAAGQKFKLADQFRLAHQGDVARRVGLHKPGNSIVNVTNVHNVTRATNVFGARGFHHGFHHHPHFHHRGWISPLFHNDCFLFRSWFGPSWYPGTWWYPRWTPWVHWSWHHYGNPFWDPRPIWCRPVIYPVAVQPWVAWDVPVWNPLPEVPAGTWVNVQRPVIAEEQFDLQVLAVRFVDPGHPDEKLGPRYRVWLRNNSNKPITRAFDVRLFAAPGEELVANAPQAAVRVTAIEAGDTQSVDIRLPFQETAEGAEGKPPFQFLHVVADANREIRDANAANNGSRVPLADVLPVDPAAFETDAKTIAAGGELVIAGEGFGPEPGKVLIHLGNIEMEAEVLGWYDLGVRLKMPDLPLAEATKADVVVIRGDGAAANPVPVTVNPPQR